MASGFKIAEGYMDVTADSSKARREIDGFFRDVNGRLHDARGRFAREGDLAGEEWADRLQKAADRKSSQGFGSLARRFGKRFLSIGGMAGKLFANGFVLKAVAGLAALPTVISAAGALAQGIAQIGGSAALLAPAAIGGAVFSLVSLKLAFSGVGAALKAGLLGDMEKFNEALKKLAPSAQQAAKALVALAPAARDLKRNVQEDFFAPWVRDIKPLANTYLPILSQRMAALANFAGTALHQVAMLFTPPAAATAFATMLDNFVLTFGNLSSMVPGLVAGFFNLATAGSSWLARMSTGLGDVADRFSAWTASFTDSGGFDAFVSRGLTLLGELGSAAKNIAGIFQTIFAAVPGGGGLFAALGQLTAGLNAFLQTAQGQQVLNGFFARLQTLAGLIMDLVKGALPGLLTLSGALLQGFQALAPVAGPVGEALGRALAALAPLLPLLGNLLAPLLQLTGVILQALAAELGPVIELFSELAQQVFPLLLPLITALGQQAIPPIVAAGQQLLDAFRPLIPMFVQLASTIGDQLLAYLPMFLQVSQQLIPPLVQVGQILADTWLSVFQQLAPHLPILIRLFAAMVLTFAELAVLAVQVLPLIVTMFSWFIKGAAWVLGLVLSIRYLPGAIASAASAFWGWLKGVGSAIGDFFVQIGQWFAELPGKIWAFIQQIPTIISNGLSAAFDAFFFWLGYITQTVISFVVSLPQRFYDMWETIKTTFINAVVAVGEFFSELPIKAAMFFSQLWSTVTTWVSNTYNSVVTWLGQLPDRVGAFFSDLWGRAKTSTINGVNSVIDFVKSLPGKIKSALSDAGSWLYNIGSDIVHGLVNGFNSALDWARDMIGRAMEKLKEGAKAALHISSPSRDFDREVGRQIPAGIIQGVRKGMPDLERVLQMRVGGLTAAASRPQVNVAAPNVAVGGPSIVVLIDGEEISARINTPQQVARANVEGMRRRNYLNSGRAATA